MSSTTSKPSKATALARVQALIAGTKTHFPTSTITLGNTAYTDDATDASISDATDATADAADTAADDVTDAVGDGSPVDSSDEPGVQFPTSCLDVQSRNPDAGSGQYTIYASSYVYGPGWDYCNGVYYNGADAGADAAGPIVWLFSTADPQDAYE